MGETQLETDRRVIRRRIAHLTEELRHISAHREVQRRKRQSTFEVALVGYTNVGKSSLLNRLTSARVQVENRLFSTLDTTFRRLPLQGVPMEVLLIDTVGLVRKLPHHLVASFRSTLEQAREADLILHVVDVSHPAFEEQAQTALTVLAELDMDEIPVLTVLNKRDRATLAFVERAQGLYPEALATSALTGEGLPELLDAVKKAIFKHGECATLTIPYDKWPDFLNARKSLRVAGETYGEKGVTVSLRARPEVVAELRREFCEI